MIAAINIVSQSLGVQVVVKDIGRRSDTGSFMTDDLLKVNMSTLNGFMKKSNRIILIPNTIWE